MQAAPHVREKLEREKLVRKHGAGVSPHRVSSPGRGDAAPLVRDAQSARRLILNVLCVQGHIMMCALLVRATAGETVCFAAQGRHGDAGAVGGADRRRRAERGSTGGRAPPRYPGEDNTRWVQLHLAR